MPPQALTDLTDKEIGLTARDLSRASGIDSATLSNIEHGHRRPSQHQAAAIATALELRPGELRTLWERTRERRMTELRQL